MALTTDIKAYYKLDESSGNAADATGNGNTLTNNNTALYGPGIINNGVVATSVGPQYLSIGSTLGISDGTDFTITGWFNIASFATGDQALWDLGFTATSYTQNAIRVNGSTIKYDRGRRCVAQQHVDYSTTINTGTWYFVCQTFTASSSTVKGFLNASEVASSVLSGIGSNGCAPTAHFFIGQDGDFTNCNATIDEVGVWNRVLTGPEITQLYNGGAGLQYPFTAGPTNVKTWNGLAFASVKTINGLATGSIKTVNGLG